MRIDPAGIDDRIRPQLPAHIGIDERIEGFLAGRMLLPAHVQQIGEDRAPARRESRVVTDTEEEVRIVIDAAPAQFRSGRCSLDGRVPVAGGLCRFGGLVGQESAAASSSTASAGVATAKSRIGSSARILCLPLLGLEARQVIPLQPRLRHVTPGVLAVAHDRDPVRIEAIDNDRFRGPFNAELRLVVTVVRRLQQSVAFGVELRLDRAAAGRVDPHLDVMIGDIRRCGGKHELVAVPGLTLAILDVLLGGELRLVVLGEVDRYDVAIGRLTQKPLLRRQANARFAGRVVEPEIVAVLEHELAGISRRRDEPDEAAELTADRSGLRVERQRGGVALAAVAVFDQRYRQTERLAGLRIASLAARIACAPGAATARTGNALASASAINPRIISEKPSAGAARRSVHACVQWASFSDRLQTCRSASTITIRPAARAGHHADRTATSTNPAAVPAMSMFSPHRRTAKGIRSTCPGGNQVSPD